LAGPDRTDFIGGFIAESEDKIELRRSLLRKLIPVLGPKVLDGMVQLLDEIKCIGMNPPLGRASGTIGLELTHAFTVEDDFAHDRACRVAGAQEQYVEYAIRHGAFLPASNRV
jgi:hypothetical protein